MKKLKSLRWLLLVAGVLMVILGIYTLFVPTGALSSMAVFISITMFISGVSEIASYVGEDDLYRSGWVLAGGILETMLGLWLLIGRGYAQLAAAIPFIIAVWVLCSGILRTVGSFTLRSSNAGDWGWTLAFGILEIALGFAFIFYPILSAVLASILIAGLFISHGISNIMLFSGITRIKNLFKKLPGDHKGEDRNGQSVN